MKGKISTFGGANDAGMTHTEGLSLYEHHEADLRPDLFFPRSSDPTEGTSKRLRPDALYFAYRFKHEVFFRKDVQQTPFILRNPKNGKMVCVSLVDWGPAEWTGRMFDLSPKAAELLGVETDEEVEIV